MNVRLHYPAVAPATLDFFQSGRGGSGLTGARLRGTIPRLLYAVMVIGTLGMVGCSDPFAPAPDDVRAFAVSEGLPQIRRVETVRHLRAEDVLFFRVTFGPPRDCPSGCFYDTALGLRHAGEIGWLEVAGTPGVYDPSRQHYMDDRSGRRFFSVSPAHDGLFSASLLDQLLSDSTLYASLAAFLASHDSTPEPALFRLAERLPAGWTHTAILIATHPNARCSRAVQDEVLKVPGSPFSGARTAAAEILAAMPERCD
jgi:hypothetical protein